MYLSLPYEHEREREHEQKFGLIVESLNLTTIIHSSTGPVVHPFAFCHEGPGFNSQGGIYVKPGFSC